GHHRKGRHERGRRRPQPPDGRQGPALRRRDRVGARGAGGRDRARPCPRRRWCRPRRRQRRRQRCGRRRRRRGQGRLTFIGASGTSLMDERIDVVVVGGGVIGLCTALSLVEAGRSVRLLEAKTLGSGSSHGNCGTLTPSHAAPLCAPGTIAQAMRWMLTPDAPLYVAPRVGPGLWRWLLGFARRCNTRDWRAALRARAAILNDSISAYPGWVARHAPGAEFADEGVDYVFHTGPGFDSIAREIPLLAEVGIAAEVIDGAAYEREEPAFKPGIHATIRFPGDARLRPDR